VEPYTGIHLVACLVAAASAGAVLARAPAERANQVAAAMMGCSAWWSLCEVIWNNLGDPVWVLRTIRLSGLGWISLGPLVLHLVLEGLDDTHSRLRRGLPWAYASAGAGQALYLSSPLALASVSPTPWGWTYSFGPLFGLVAAPTMVLAGVAIARWQASLSRADHALERRQVRQALAGMTFTLVAAAVTDVLLPQAGIDFPRMGSASAVLFCGFIAYGVLRHDYFVLAPGALAEHILESLHDGAVLLSDGDRIEFANAAFVRLTGSSHEQLVGVDLAEFLPGIGSVEGKGTGVAETDLVVMGGGLCPVAVSSSELHDKSGAILGRVIAVRDLSDVAAMRDRVLTAGRLGAMGELAAGVVHEISGPIAYMRTNLAVLRRTWDEVLKALGEVARGGELAAVLAEGDEVIDESLEGAERIARLIASVRVFTHAGLGERELADVNVLLQAAVGMAEPKLRQRRVRVETDLGDVPPLDCAPQELKQLFLNLLVNAVNAVGSGDEIRVRSRMQGERIVVDVEDDGCGMSPETLRTIFDPVHMLGRRDGGFAIGLPACHEIVRRHGGEIGVTSEEGRGTAFRITLRAALSGTGEALAP
jgi:signal transduction histidine kinase